jgi:hypothetical protein
MNEAALRFTNLSKAYGIIAKALLEAVQLSQDGQYWASCPALLRSRLGGRDPEETKR